MSSLDLDGLVLQGNDPSYCQYLSDGKKTSPPVLITFTAAPKDAEAFEAGLKLSRSDITPVAGLGDSAFSYTGAPGSSGLSFLSNKTICGIVTTVSTTTEAKESLARLILAG